MLKWGRNRQAEFLRNEMEKVTWQINKLMPINRIPNRDNEVREPDLSYGQMD